MIRAADSRLEWRIALTVIIGMSLGIAGYAASGQLPWLAIGPAVLVAWIGLRDLRLLFGLLLCTIPVSMELMVTDSLGTDMPDEPLMWVFTVVLLLGAAAGKLPGSSRKFSRWVLFLLILQVMWIALSCLMSPQPLLSAKYLAAKLWYLAAFTGGAWLFIRRVRDVRWAAWCLLIPLSLAVGWVFFRHGQSGFAFDQVNAAVQPLYRNHVNYGALLAVLLPLAILLWVQQRRHRFILGILIGWFSLGLLFSYSRGAWLAIGVGVLTALALRGRWLMGALALVAISLVLGLAWLARENRYLAFRPDFDRTIYHQDFRKHLQATYRLKDLSTVERFHRWIAGVRMVEDRPWTGHGPNRFYPAYKPYTVRAFRTYVSDNPEHSTVHNYFLLLAVEQGLPGCLLFILLLWAMFSRVSRAYQASTRSEEKQVWMTVAVMLSIMVWLNMLSDLVETDKIGSLFLLCLGLLLNREGPEEGNGKEYPKLAA